jgi:hypothetical protein
LLSKFAFKLVNLCLYEAVVDKLVGSLEKFGGSMVGLCTS